MRVWVDLANSPHPVLFAPVVRRLTELGAEVELTARDHAQTAALAVERWPDVEVIGGASPHGSQAKAGGLLRRTLNLRRWARARRIDVALSHNSYAQLLAARSLGIPAVTGMDYEHQPANHIGFRCARRILVPTALPVPTLRRQGATAAKLVRYDGLKEELYLGEFVPDARVLERVGVDPKRDRALVVARTAPVGAAYHRAENPMLLRAVEWAARQDGVDVVVLARHPEQRSAIEALGLPTVRVPDAAIDGLSLTWHADLFLGAGGTMTREAALLGVRTYSVFAGRPAAVDRALEQRGLLLRLDSPQEIAQITRGTVARRASADVRAQGERLIELFASVAITGAQGLPPATP
jgi:predicted glycosyltransferase